jgi:hypothetical protein
LTDTKNNKTERSEEQTLLIGIQVMFYKDHEEDVSSCLRKLSEYASYLSEHIDYETINIDVDKELLDLFESVVLWLSDKLYPYPEFIRNDIFSIIHENRLRDVVSIIANLSKRHLYLLRRKKSAFGLFFAVSSMFLKIDESKIGIDFISPEILFKAKVALNRIAQILKYAATLEVESYDEEYEDFSNNYNPNLVDKHKILALINVLRVQINKIPNNKNTKLILEKLDKIEKELKKPKIRWGLIISGFFILFGFIADLKTLEPHIYEAPQKVVEQILNVIHRDGCVQQENQFLLREKGGSPVNPMDRTETDNPPLYATISNEKKEAD